MFVFPGPGVTNDDAKPGYKIDLADKRLRRISFIHEDGQVGFYIAIQKGEICYFLEVWDRAMAQAVEDAFARVETSVLVGGRRNDVSSK